MRKFVILIACLGLLPTTAPAQEPEEEPMESVPPSRVRPKEIPRTFSTESQFTVYGSNGDLRVEAFRLAESTRKSLLATLAQKTRLGKINLDKGRIPIVLELNDRFTTGQDIVKGTIQLMPDDSINFHLQIAAGGGLNVPVVTEELVRWLLVDLMMRRVRAENLANAGELHLPDWLHQGILELMSYQNRGRPSEVFASVFRLGKTLTIQEILNADISGMDGVSTTIYRVSCSALLLMMLDQPNGAEKLIACISDLPANQGPISRHLEHYFPILGGSENQLEKWWSLSLATIAQPTRMELMTMQETDAALTEALQVTYQPPAPPSEKTPRKLLNLLKKKPEPTAETLGDAPPPADPIKASVEDFAPLLEQKDIHPITQQALLAITKLSLRAHPFYRSILDEYQKEIAKIPQRKTSGLTEAFADLSRRRAKMMADARAVEDYLDWYEATQRESLSDSFRQYLQTAEQLEHPPARRRDPISRYLDAIEKEYK